MTAHRQLGSGKLLVPPTLDKQYEPGAAVRLALETVHPFTQDPPLGEDLRAVLARVAAADPQLQVEHRAAMAQWLIGAPAD